MKTITSEDLNEDVFDGHYLDIPLKIYLKNKEVIEGVIDYYTHDEEPFINYLVIKDKFELIDFNDIEKIEILD
ncbi:MAG: hypothetical protein PUG22_04530 [Peptoniphilaceae bacterium]|nr:hypothetical protein [Peptoniphilaceae bacterium]